MGVTLVPHTCAMKGNLLMSFGRRETVGKSLLIHAVLFLTISLLPLTLSFPALASSGTEGAAFLDIPVGAGPAAMGSAYTALANDAYAATWNPAGLGTLESTQFSGQHLS